MKLGHPEAMKRVIRGGVGAGLLFRSCVEDELTLGILREILFADARLRGLDAVDRLRTELPSACSATTGGAGAARSCGRRPDRSQWSARGRRR